MPVNSFENYYMSFAPDKSSLKTPYVESLARLLEMEIISGKLPPHTQLPPQRELADYLDISLQTVTQAYAICKRKGLLYGITGRGSFVHPGAIANLSTGSMYSPADTVNMAGINIFPQFNSLIADKVRTAFQNIDFEKMLYDSTYNSRRAVTDKAEEWLSFFNMPSRGKNIVITFSRQNGLAVVMSSLFKAGDVILTDEYIYPFFKQLSMNFGVQLVPVQADREGMSPARLEDACKILSVKGIYLTPTCQNPLGYSMSLRRRQEIAEIIEKYNLILIEDDTSRLGVMDDTKPVSCFAGENGIYLCDVSSVYSENLGLGILSVPQKYYGKIFLGTLGINLSIAPALQCNLLSFLADREFVRDISQKKQECCVKRNKLFDSYFPGMESANDKAPFRWIKLPEKFSKFTGIEFEKLRREKGLSIYHSDRFAVGNVAASHTKYIRAALSSPDTDEKYIEGLERLKKILQ